VLALAALFLKLEFRISGPGGEVVAETKRKQTEAGVALGEDVLSLTATRGDTRDVQPREHSNSATEEKRQREDDARRRLSTTTVNGERTLILVCVAPSEYLVSILEFVCRLRLQNREANANAFILSNPLLSSSIMAIVSSHRRFNRTSDRCSAVQEKKNAMEAVIPVLKTAARPDHEARLKRGGGELRRQILALPPLPTRGRANSFGQRMISTLRNRTPRFNGDGDRSSSAAAFSLSSSSVMGFGVGRCDSWFGQSEGA
jgi:hypothetical protein